MNSKLLSLALTLLELLFAYMGLGQPPTGGTHHIFSLEFLPASFLGIVLPFLTEKQETAKRKAEKAKYRWF